MANTHFSGPVLYSGKGASTGAWGTDLPIGVNLGVVEFFDDFTVTALGTVANGANNWTVVKDTSAAAAIGDDIQNGVLDLTSQATTDNDGASVQSNEIFKATADKSIWFETVLQCNKVDQTDICVGLTVNFATNPEAMLAAADRIVFQVDDGSASILCKTESGGTETSTDSGVGMVNDTYITLGFKVSGTGLVQFYVNRNLVAQHTTNIPTTELAVAAMSVSGDNLGTRRTRIDYLFAAATR
jgi:hypothetical protein